MARILLVDDDVELCELVTEYLRGEGLEVEVAHDGAAGLDRAVSGEHELLLLDVMLPGLTGFEVLRKLRDGSALPVIMLTARGDDVDRIVGLEMGADDYLPKPFNPRELAARIRAVLRRAEPVGERPGTHAVGDLEVDLGARSVRVGGSEIDVTGVEFAVLECLIRSVGQVVSRDQLSQAALFRKASAFDRSLDVHISNLRRKLGSTPDGSDRIKTVRGVGYQMVRQGGAGS